MLIIIDENFNKIIDLIMDENIIELEELFSDGCSNINYI